MRILRSFSWKGVMVFFGFAAAMTLWTWSGVLFASKQMGVEEYVVYYFELLQRILLNYFPAYLLVGLADGLDLAPARRRIVLAAALVLGVLLAVQVRCAVSMNETFHAYDSVVLPYCTTFPTWRTYLDFPGSWLTNGATAGMVTIFIFTMRRDRELVASLHRVRASEVDERRLRAESEIETMQARVDPDGLLQTLKAVRERYETSIDGGEAMLEDLINGLRHAARHPSEGQAA
jgi:hypothetical protein